jgi:outer membrane protein assembly factor BamB
MKPSNLIAAAILFISGTAFDSVNATDWPQWRGPDGTGYAANCNPPTQWSGTKNIRWKVEIPGAGHASPIVVGDRVYVLTAVRAGQADPSPKVEPDTADDRLAGRDETRRRGGREGRRRRGRMGAPKPSQVYEFYVLALDRRNGEMQWRTKVREEVPHEGTHRTASFASSTPVADDEHVYAFFGSRGIFCLDMDGRVKWEKDLGEMRTRNSFGEGGSPALYGDTFVVPWDHEGDSVVVALDKNTGDEKWRVNRTERTSWTSPVIVQQVEGTTQVVMAGAEASIGYELSTGKEIWRCSGLTMNVVPTPVVGNGMIYLMSGFRGSALQALKLDEAEGDISGSDAVVWTVDRGTPYVPSPLLSGDRLYCLRSNVGNISCFDAITGVAHYSGVQLEAVANVYASLVGAGGRVYVCGREGDVVVLADGPELSILATNSLGEGIDATPAIVDDEIFIRGSRHLFCIAKAQGQGAN